MKKYRLFFLLITSLILCQCKKNEQPIDAYMTATIDGVDYIAECMSARRFSDDAGRDWLQMGSSNICVDVSGKVIFDTNFISIDFSILNDCLKPGVYDKEFIHDQFGDFIPFGYYKYLNDSSLIGNVPLDGSISIEQLEYKKNGIVKGTFEFKYTDYVDTIWIKNGKFQLKIVN